MAGCWKCEQPIEGEVHEIYTMVKPPSTYSQFADFKYKPRHIECMENEDRPDESRVCDSCGKTGKDTQNQYPANFAGGYIQHADCVDWDDVRKYRNI